MESDVELEGVSWMSADGMSCCDRVAGLEGAGVFGSELEPNPDIELISGDAKGSNSEITDG